MAVAWRGVAWHGMGMGVWRGKKVRARLTQTTLHYPIYRSAEAVGPQGDVSFLGVFCVCGSLFPATLQAKHSLGRSGGGGGRLILRQWHISVLTGVVAWKGNGMEELE